MDFRKVFGREWCHQVSFRLGTAFIEGLLRPLLLIIDARSAVRMAGCSYCQRINAFRPVKAVVVEAPQIESWSYHLGRHLAPAP